MDLCWHWKAPIAVVNLWRMGLVITPYMGERLERIDVAMTRSLRDQAQYAQVLSLADRALRSFPASREIQALRQECRARVSALSEGAGISTGIARRYSQDPQEIERTSRTLGLSIDDRVCAKCSSHCTNFARTGTSAVGGGKMSELRQLLLRAPCSAGPRCCLCSRGNDLCLWRGAGLSRFDGGPGTRELR